MLANLRALLGVIVDIILFRRGPEAVPASQVLLALVVAINVAGSVLLGGSTGTSFGEALLQSLLGCTVMLLWFRAALVLARKAERFLQTVTALFAVNAVFLPAMVPMFAALVPYLEKSDPATQPPAALFMLTLIVGFWVLIVQVRIVRAAFECPWIGAILLVVGEVFAAGFVAMLLFGSPEKGA
jgi:hypothetical protein